MCDVLGLCIHSTLIFSLLSCLGTLSVLLTDALQGDIRNKDDLEKLFSQTKYVV